jgi:hypothetical protein
MPKTNWRRNVSKELEQMNLSWVEAKHAAREFLSLMSHRGRRGVVVVVVRHPASHFTLPCVAPGGLEKGSPASPL